VIPDATAIAKGILKLAGQLGGTADSPTVTGVTETGGPTALAMGAVPDGQYLKRVGATVAGGTLPDAAAATKGVIQLAGALGGTAASPKVVGITEATGPTDLAIGSIVDGEFLKRVGGTIVSAPAGGGGVELKSSGLFVTASITAGASLEVNIAAMFDEGTIIAVGIYAASTTLKTMIEFWSSDAFAPGISCTLLYRAGDFDAATDVWVDYVPFYYFDSDVTGEVHLKIYNHGSVDSVYSVYVTGQGS
jgi:hypothetical protein